MKRRSLILLLAATVAGAFFLTLLPAGSQRNQSPGVAPATPWAAGLPIARPAPAVKIEQQLVRADVITETARASTARVSSPRKPALDAGRRAPRKVGFFAAARRVLFGGGRHKPSPFPTPQ